MGCSDDTTVTLVECARGDARAADELMPQVYDQLRALAGRFMQDERAGHTLQPTALVNEAYMRMVRIERVDWQGKAHFFAVAARQMRRILIDHAHAKGAKKRGERMSHVTLDEGVLASSEDPVAILALEQALVALERRNPRQSRVAELRLFAGMQVKEIAHVLGVSERTVKGDWRFARAWLMRELGSAPAQD